MSDALDYDSYLGAGTLEVMRVVARNNELVRLATRGRGRGQLARLNANDINR